MQTVFFYLHWLTVFSHSECKISVKQFCVYGMIKFCINYRFWWIKNWTLQEKLCSQGVNAGSTKRKRMLLSTSGKHIGNNCINVLTNTIRVYWKENKYSKFIESRNWRHEYEDICLTSKRDTWFKPLSPTFLPIGKKKKKSKIDTNI